MEKVEIGRNNSNNYIQFPNDNAMDLIQTSALVEDSIRDLKVDPAFAVTKNPDSGPLFIMGQGVD